MEEIVKDIARFWSEAIQILKEVVEKGSCEAVDLPAQEPGMPLPDVPCSQNENPCK